MSPQEPSRAPATDLENLSDDALAKLCRQRGSGDDRPFAELFRRHRQHVWNICRRFFHHEEDASDLVQETFFKAFRGLRKFSGGHPLLFRSWLSQIAVNTCKNEIRTRARRPRKASEPPSLALESRERGPAEVLIDRRSQDRLSRALATLAPAQREILELAELAETPYSKLAEDLGISRSAVEMRALRARAALAAAYRELEARGGT